jgi:hypothetical protein
VTSFFKKRNGMFFKTERVHIKIAELGLFSIHAFKVEKTALAYADI